MDKINATDDKEFIQYLLGFIHMMIQGDDCDSDFEELGILLEERGSSFNKEFPY